MMRSLGIEASCVGVARTYADFASVLVIDEQDRALAVDVEAAGMRAVVTDTIMKGAPEKRALAAAALAAIG